MRFRKKPVEIEAFRLAYDAAPDWWDCAKHSTKVWTEGPHEIIETLEGNMQAAPGDWIVKGVEGELYPVKPSVFDKTYERIEP